MKKALIAAGSLAALLAGAWLALPLIVDANRFRGVIQSSLEKQVGHPVRLGALGLRVFPLAVSAGDVSVAGLLTAKELDVRASLASLFSGTIAVESITLVEPVIEVVKNERGVLNWSEIGGKSPSGKSTGYAVQQVRLERARIGYTDRAARKARVEYGPLDLDVRGIAPGAVPSIDASMDYSGVPLKLSLPPSGDAKLSAGDAITLAGPVVLRNGEIDATLSGRADVAKMIPVLKALGIDAPVDPQGSITAQLRYQKAGWRASGDLAGIGVAGLSIASAKYTAGPDTAEIRDIAATLAGSGLRGRIGVRNFSSPSITFVIEADKLDLAEMQKASGRSSGANKRPLAGITGSGTLSAAKLIANSIEIDNVRAEVRIANEQVRLSPLTASLFGGRQSGSLTYNARTDPAEIAVDLQLDEADADRMLSATTSVKRVLAGLLDARGNFAFSTASDPAALARSLNGAVTFKLNRGKIQGINLLNELAGLGKFLGWSKQPQSVTDLLGMSGDLRIADGVASTDNLRIELDGAGIGAAGTMDLAAQSLNLKLSALLSKEFSARAGGNQIGGFLSTAFANERGELVIPAIVTGTFAQPRFAPDPEAVAKSKLKGLVGGSSGSPKEQIQGIFDRFRKK